MGRFLALCSNRGLLSLRKDDGTKETWDLMPGFPESLLIKKLKCIKNSYNN